MVSPEEKIVERNAIHPPVIAMIDTGVLHTLPETLNPYCC